QEILIELERVLPWRQRGWVTADTHVHFLSPISAMLEGSAEGVNVINLLASQWGEMMSNVGDFDGRNTWGSKEAGGDGEHLVRVGTENRQHVLGHISLLGYQGPIIVPMTTGGPDESALGDPIEVLLIEWARQCRQQAGLVVLPHFPHPRAEHAAGIISGDVDAIEMTSLHYAYRGIDPYSIVDWYRYLNCGYLVPAVGGTDKMGACTAVGTVRTYARIEPDTEFTYETWKGAIRRGETFVTYGPLLEFLVDGKPMGRRITMSSQGGTVDVTWQAASVTMPLSRVELVVNGEIRESVAVPPDEASGHWSVKVERSAWLALLVRGHYADKPEIIAAHSTPVMVDVEGAPLLAAADAITILEQIEGAMAYLDTVGTRAEERAYRRMHLALQSAHRSLHNRLHQQGYYHEHTPANDHAEHR
ncbi:MAG: CehA/McbA family metallohydrolase, partial [Anaerolineae bacterium]